jgi:hypothetical protein
LAWGVGIAVLALVLLPLGGIARLITRAVTSRRAALVAAVMAAAAALAYLPAPAPGLYLEFRLVSPHGIDETAALSAAGSQLCILARLVTPEGAVPVAGGCFDGIPVVRIPQEVLAPHAGRWGGLLAARGVPRGAAESHQVGLIIDAVVLDKDGSEVYRAHDSIPLALVDLSGRLAVRYVAYLRRGETRVEWERAAPAGLLSLRVATASAVGPGGALCFRLPRLPGSLCWALAARATPENLTALLPARADPATGLHYIGMPVLAILNSASRGEPVVVSAAIGTGPPTGPPLGSRM